MTVWVATPAAVLLGTLAVTVDKRLMSVILTLVKIKTIALYVMIHQDNAIFFLLPEGMLYVLSSDSAAIRVLIQLVEVTIGVFYHNHVHKKSL